MRITEAINDTLLRTSPTYAGWRAVRAHVQIPVAAYLLEAGGKDLHERTSLDPLSGWLSEAYKRGMQAALDEVVNGNITNDQQRASNLRASRSYPDPTTPPHRSHVTLKELNMNAMEGVRVRPALTNDEGTLGDDPAAAGMLRIIRSRFQESAGQAYVAWVNHDPGVYIPDYPVYPPEYGQPQRPY